MFPHILSADFVGSMLWNEFKIENAVKGNSLFMTCLANNYLY